MNPLLGKLHPYPFERLRALTAGIVPNPALRPISLGIGEPRHATPALVEAAITGNLQSSLAQHADQVLDCSVEREACPLNLAPTTSTTAQLALGDALAVALLDARGFRAEDFARSHPGGALGRKLLMHVHDLMRSGGDVPRVAPQAIVVGAVGAGNIGAGMH